MAYQKLVPYEILEKAVNGDELALEEVLAHYEGYLKTLATRKCVDDWGNVYTVFDDEICNDLRMHLAQKILTFDLNRP